MVTADEINQESRIIDKPMGEKKKKKPEYRLEDIRSLTDYYQIDRLTASRFLSAMGKNKVGKLREDEIQRCLENLDAKDPEFSRTLELLYRSVGVQTPISKQCINYAIQACMQQLRVHHAINIDLNKSAKNVFDEVLQILKRGLTGKKVDNRSLNILKALGIWKSHSRNLDDVEVTELLSKELIPKKKGKGSGGISSVTEILFRPSTKIQAMIDMLRIAEGSVTKANLARQSENLERQKREKEYERVQSLREKLKYSEEDLRRKEEEIGKLKASLVRTENENVSLKQTIKQDQAVSIHGKGELKGRSRIFLEKKLNPLLETALEFTELDPPRKNIIVERLEMARQEIRNEIEWLESTD